MPWGVQAVPWYSELLTSVPETYVGPASRLRSVVRLLGGEMAAAFQVTIRPPFLLSMFSPGPGSAGPAPGGSTSCYGTKDATTAGCKTTGLYEVSQVDAMVVKGIVQHLEVIAA